MRKARTIMRGPWLAGGVALLVLSAAGLPSRAATAGQGTAAAPDGDVEKGKGYFLAYGCYSCHGIEGQGGFAGPKLGPDPLAFPAFVRYVRAPRGTMPPYTETLLPDEQKLADIHAYLRARPGPASLTVLPPP